MFKPIATRLCRFAAKSILTLCSLWGVSFASLAQENSTVDTASWVSETTARNRQIYTAFISLWGGYNGSFDSSLNEEDKKLVLAAIFDTTYIFAFLKPRESGCEYYHSTDEAELDVGFLGRSLANSQRAEIEVRNDLLEEVMKSLSSDARGRANQFIGTFVRQADKFSDTTNYQDMERHAYLNPGDVKSHFSVERCLRLVDMRERLESGEFKVYGEDTFTIQ